jgi:hypothetical protein
VLGGFHRLKHQEGSVWGVIYILLPLLYMCHAMFPKSVCYMVWCAVLGSHGVVVSKTDSIGVCLQAGGWGSLATGEAANISLDGAAVPCCAALHHLTHAVPCCVPAGWW